MALLWPDYQRDLRARVARGAQIDMSVPPSRDQREAYEQAHDHTRLAAFGKSGVEVRWIFRGGRALPWPDDEGFSRTSFSTRGRSRMDIAEDAEAARLDVVELRIPMMVNNTSGVAVKVLVGFQFGWNGSRQQWIPYQNVTYAAPGEEIAAIPF